MLVLGQTFHNDSWGLFQVRDHLQVKVSWSQDSPVEGAKLNYNLLMDAEGPALMPEQQSTILDLKENDNPGELTASGFSEQTTDILTMIS